MNLTLLSGIALVVIFVVAEYCGYVLKIYTNKFFNKFHFLAGLFLYLFLFSLTGNLLVSVSLTFTAGVLWEIHEWILYYTILKKDKRYRPDDSLTDLLFDLLGIATAVVFFAILRT